MTMLKIIKTGETKSMMNFEELYTGLKIVIMKDNFNKALKLFRYWQQDISGSNFTSQLFNLICHADEINKIKILKGFPEEMIIYQLWYTHPEGEQGFWREYEEPEECIN